MNPKNNQPQRPIGYWLKHADDVITQHVNQVLSDQGLTRFHWQVLNIVHEAGRITQKQVFEPMQTFVEAAGLDAIISEFENRGWMIRHEKGGSGVTELELTDQGKEGHRAIFSFQSEVRKQAVQGVSEEEYMTVIRV